MKISILLPYKEDYSPNYSGAVSIHVSNLYKYSRFKKFITIWGNTKIRNIYPVIIKIFQSVKDFYQAIIKNI